MKQYILTGESAKKFMEIKNHNDEKLKERIGNMRINLKNGRFVEMNDDGFWSGYDDVMGEISAEQLVTQILEIGVLNNNNDEVEKLKKQLDNANRTIRRLNMEAQRWFDLSMDLLHKEDK